MAILKINRRAAAYALLAIGLGSYTATHASDTYPQRPVRIVVPFTAGGTTDMVARLIADRLTPKLGQQVIIENRPGAAGVVATAAVTKAPADGYTILMGSTGPISINPHLTNDKQYDSLRDLKPISMISSSQIMVFSGPSVGVSSLEELIALAKSRPGSLNYASAGTGGTMHLTGEMFNKHAGIHMIHVPYRGTAQAVTDLMAGQVDVLFDQAPAVMPHVLSGKIKALATIGDKRVGGYPDIPTTAEAGVPDLSVLTWFGFFVPTGTPAPIVALLDEKVGEVLQDSEVREKYLEIGLDPEYKNSNQFEDHLAEEIENWRDFIRASNIVLN